MVPIHDTDVAENRWADAEWKHYELWEKVEVRLRRKKWIWIGATFFVFIILSSIPIIIDRWPKWTSLGASRRLAQEMNSLKRSAAIEKSSYRIRFISREKPEYVIERGASCSGNQWENVRSGMLMNERRAANYVILRSDEAQKFQIPGLLDSFCYDPLSGSSEPALSGFGIIPVKDLTVDRQDRASFLLFSGQSAEISFD